MGRIAVIGAGFSGLSAAAYLAAAGHEVEVFEKNASPGGRARQQTVPEGYTFDMGPSWYWMPDVFTRFFADFGSSPEEHYRLTLLDPSFEVVYGPGNSLPIPADYPSLRGLFDEIEPGSAQNLDKFLREAQHKYETAMSRLIYSPSLSILEFLKPGLLCKLPSMHLLTSMRRHVRSSFRHPKLTTLMEFPVLFLGGLPQHIPALYSLMNYAGLRLGTWYPQGGFGQVVKSIVRIGEKLGVKYHYNSPVETILVKDQKVTAILVDGQAIPFDAVLAAADYHHVEQRLLPEQYRNYPASYWNRRTMAPSCLIYYIGLRKRLPRLQHHTLFFDGDMESHSRDIYTQPQWPAHPQFYVGCPSRTDTTIAPSGHENLFLLMPLAPGLKDGTAIREKYFRLMMDRLETHTGESITPFIDYKKSYGVTDFTEDYHAYLGNAYGLANTLRQTAWWKPKIRNRKLKNLFYAGQLTVPGPGVPPALISGKIAAGLLLQYLKRPQP